MTAAPRLRRWIISALLVGIVGTVTGSATYAAFSSTTADGGNLIAAGTVVIGDNDAGGAMLSLAGALPGDSDTGCIQIAYSGTLDSTVRLYGSVAGALAPYLTLTVTRGNGASCAAFAADATDYIGAGPGVVYSGALSAYPATYGGGIVDPIPGSPETWTIGETHAYRFTAGLNPDPAAEGLSSTATFTWEARNL